MVHGTKIDRAQNHRTYFEFTDLTFIPAVFPFTCKSDQQTYSYHNVDCFIGRVFCRVTNISDKCRAYTCGETHPFSRFPPFPIFPKKSPISPFPPFPILLAEPYIIFRRIFPWLLVFLVVVFATMCCTLVSFITVNFSNTQSNLFLKVTKNMAPNPGSD